MKLASERVRSLWETAEDREIAWDLKDCMAEWTGVDRREFVERKHKVEEEIRRINGELERM
jgi:hypothetical protein